MGNLYRPFLNDAIAIKDDVQIDRPGSEFVPRAPAAEVPFHSTELRFEFLGREIGFYFRD